MSIDLPRTIVLGLDGLDARLVRVLMDVGLLPQMKRLAQVGGFRRVISTTPAESAVAWTSFTRGVNPGRTGVFDFVGRRPGSYMPHLVGTDTASVSRPPSPATRKAIAAGAGVVAGAGGYALAHRLTRRQWLKRCAAIGAAGALAGGTGLPWMRWWPTQRPWVESTVRGEPWWQGLAAAGQRCTALRVPMAYPARADPRVKLLAGLGVPDIFGTQGTHRLLSDDPADARDDRTIPIQWQDGRARIPLPGPASPVDPASTATVALDLERLAADRIRIASGRDRQQLRRGQWSETVRLAFRHSPLIQQRAVTRLHFCADGPGVRLYMEPLQYDPADPPRTNPISSPPQFATSLHERAGEFTTLGWETPTVGLIANVLDDTAYLAAANRVLDQNEAHLHGELDRGDWDQFMAVVQASDQISHMFLDDSAAAMREGGQVSLDHPLIALYRRMDALVGQVHAKAEALNARLVVMSDHGFCRYSRSLNLNTWLAHRGYLALKDHDRWDESSADAVLSRGAWSNVNWFNTRAFALGLSGIYLNVEGREPGGIVKPAGEYEFVQERLIRDLKAWRDPATNEPVFSEVYRRQDVYDGPYVDQAPDLVVGLREGYRVSSATVVGGIPEGAVRDNESAWQADHCGVDARFVPGICLTSFANDWPQQMAISSFAHRIWPAAFARHD